MTIFKQARTWEVTDKLLVAKKNKYKCVFSNPSQYLFIKTKVDGCQITDGIRCDHLILDHRHNEHFVELKGRDLLHVAEQLEVSIQQLSALNYTIKKRAIIVSSRNPSNDTSVQRAEAMFGKKYGAELIPKNIQIEITIE